MRRQEEIKAFGCRGTLIKPISDKTELADLRLQSPWIFSLPPSKPRIVYSLLAPAAL
jgi:hypothetical protein